MADAMDLPKADIIRMVDEWMQGYAEQLGVISDSDQIGLAIEDLIAERDALKAAVSLAAVGKVPAGFALVSIDPTPPMIEAGTKATWEDCFMGEYTDPDPEDISREACRSGALAAWAAMVGTAIALHAAEPAP